MLVLGIESSCDETALALVNEQGLVADVMSSQVDVHALFGGVVPELASREHARLIRPLFRALWEKSAAQLPGISLAHVDALAVTRGPGLLGCLLVGMAFAKALSLGRGIPLIGVNHLHAHLLVAGMGQNMAWPALGLLVSGGHTHLYRMESPTSMTTMGRTLDDAAGEACDKFAKMLGLPYPGGALLDRLAQRWLAEAPESPLSKRWAQPAWLPAANPASDLFPRPYVRNDNLDFSFSGLKTAAATYCAAHPALRFPTGSAPAKERLAEASPELCRVAAEYLAAVADTLALKTARALESFPARSLVLAGGVAANSFVRKAMAALAQSRGLPLLLPSPYLCTDNGVMVAWNGLLLAQAGLGHDLTLSAIPRGRVIPEDFLPRLPSQASVSV